MTRRRGDDLEISEAWREYKRAQRQRRVERLPSRQDEIEALRGKGFDVEVKNDGYHYRIDGTLDLFPIHRRYHFIPSDTRGGYRSAIECAVKFLRGGHAD